METPSLIPLSATCLRLKENAKEGERQDWRHTCTLDPNFEVPYYLSYYDIHLAARRVPHDA